MKKILLVVIWCAVLNTAAGWAQGVNPPARLVNYPQMVLYNGKIVTMDDTKLQFPFWDHC